MDDNYKILFKIGKYILAIQYLEIRNWDTEIDYKPIYKKDYIFIGKQSNFDIVRVYKKIYNFTN